MALNNRKQHAAVISTAMFGFMANVACTGGALRPAALADSGTDAQPDSMATADGMSANSDRDPNQLSPIASPPLKDDDRLDGFLNEVPGDNPNGWDFCVVSDQIGIGPGACTTCPPPAEGKKFFRYTGSNSARTCAAGPGQMCPPAPDCQVFSWFIPPLASNQTRGIWFDLLHIAGDPSDATLRLNTFGNFPETVETLGVWQLSNLLSGPPAWRTTCANITPKQSITAVGFIFAGTKVDLGMAVPRFGPACPDPSSNLPAD